MAASGRGKSREAPPWPGVRAGRCGHVSQINGVINVEQSRSTPRCLYTTSTAAAVHVRTGATRSLIPSCGTKIRLMPRASVQLFGLPYDWSAAMLSSRRTRRDPRELGPAGDQKADAAARLVSIGHVPIASSSKSRGVLCAGDFCHRDAVHLTDAPAGRWECENERAVVCVKSAAKRDLISSTKKG